MHLTTTILTLVTLLSLVSGIPTSAYDHARLSQVQSTKPGADTVKSSGVKICDRDIPNSTCVTLYPQVGTTMDSFVEHSSPIPFYRSSLVSVSCSEGEFCWMFQGNFTKDNSNFIGRNEGPLTGDDNLIAGPAFNYSGLPGFKSYACWKTQP
jgi:hypothetical protein